ncbi:MAG: hypothetical protein ACUVWN_00750 [bacterium]
MDDSQFLNLSREFKETKERIEHLPDIIESLMIEELNLRRNAHLNSRSDMWERIESIKKEREKLQAELIERKALLPILRRQIIDSSKEVWDNKVKEEKDKTNKLTEEIKSAKSKLDSAITEIFNIAVELWGFKQAKEKILDYISDQICIYIRNNKSFPEIGLEEKLNESIQEYRKKRETLSQIARVSAIDKAINPIQNVRKSKEEKIKDWISALSNVKDPKDQNT